MNRFERRQYKREIDLFSSTITILKQYFPFFIKKLDALTDSRHQSYVDYSMGVITLVRLLALLCQLNTMRQLTDHLNTEETIQNVAELLNITLDELPHYDTINDVFEQIDIQELRSIQKYVVTRLIRSKMFDKYRYKGKYFQIVIDGTGLASFKFRHCKHCLKRVHNKGQKNEYTAYLHYVLEAKLVVGDIVISLDTEFVENVTKDVEVQDCEIKAFYRMAKRIKKNYPKLAIIFSGDSLYACMPVINICIKNKWEYIIRFKKESIKTLAEEVEGLEMVEEQEEIKYWNNLKYREVQIEEQLNVLKYYEKKKEDITEFMWIVSFEITTKNKEELVKWRKAAMENRK